MQSLGLLSSSRIAIYLIFLMKYPPLLVLIAPWAFGIAQSAEPEPVFNAALSTFLLVLFFGFVFFGFGIVKLAFFCDQD